MIWVDVIKEVVDAVVADSSKPAINADAPYYLHGHPLDIVKVLQEKTTSDTLKFKKWPLIALFQDFTETIGNNQRFQSSTSLNVIIAVDTSPDYDSGQRYDNTFRTILYPVYDLFIEKLIASGWFYISSGLVPHDKIDRLYWGRKGLYGNKGNIFNDYIDAIEIQNLQLSLRNKKHCYGI